MTASSIFPAADLASGRQPIFDRQALSVRRYAALGFATILALVGGVGGWAVMTDLSGAVIAPGAVVVDGNIKKVQHPTGGIVSDILVKNGDRVKAGEVVVRLDDTITRASLQVVLKQIDELTGRLSRLRAERDGAHDVVFADALLARSEEPGVNDILAGERILFQSRIATRRNQMLQLGERITGLKQEGAGYAAQADSKAREIVLINKELEGLAQLEAKNLVRSDKMTAMRREQARIEGEMAQLSAAAGQTKDKIGEIEMQKLAIDSETRAEIVKDLRETEGKLAGLVEQRTAALDQLNRMEVRSPADGIVDQMSVFTVGGVIGSTDPIMVIVPQDDTLVIEAKIAPRDIDQARSSRIAQVRFPAFNMRTTPNLSGHVQSISAEVTHDPRLNLDYYVARVRFDTGELKKLGALELVPGMPAEVQIRTQERSALSYLLKPFEDQFAKAFKER